MIVHFHVRGLSLSAHSRHLLEESLGLLRTLSPISLAVVVLEHRGGDSPPFRVFVSLAVPGPDIHAEARDHTLSAAWLKAASALREQIQQRKARQELRIREIAPLRCQRRHRLRRHGLGRVTIAASRH